MPLPKQEVVKLIDLKPYQMLKLWIILLFGCLVHLQAAPPSVRLRIQGLSSDQGMIRLLVFDQADGFPDQIHKAILAQNLPAERESVHTVLKNLEPGRYAISVIHDENNNGQLDSNFFGYPTEPFGFSQNPKIFLTVPSFAKCAFDLKAEGSQEVHISLRK